jgi:hypothetical protein
MIRNVRKPGEEVGLSCSPPVVFRLLVRILTASAAGFSGGFWTTTTGIVT